ncbi:hypothetical protein PIB30_033346 [Stylosanthes scabra]|uniref:Uncharacterized protein n=1 Tax=Stylosanthes scabra TaxID=79078 RepID=A0ABU6WAH8_9FABA|nr:hypothetical protein [Stylosanthes scabra]
MDPQSDRKYADQIESDLEAKTTNLLSDAMKMVHIESRFCSNMIGSDLCTLISELFFPNTLFLLHTRTPVRRLLLCRAGSCARRRLPTRAGSCARHSRLLCSRQLLFSLPRPPLPRKGISVVSLFHLAARRCFIALPLSR